MKYVVTAGPVDDRHSAVWSADGGLEGDEEILGYAGDITEVHTHPEDPPVPVDWTDGNTAVPALVEAAQEAWGQPVTVTVLLSKGEKAPTEFRSQVVESVSLQQA